MGGGFGAVTCVIVKLLISKFTTGHAVWDLGSAGNGALCGEPLPSVLQKRRVLVPVPESPCPCPCQPTRAPSFLFWAMEKSALTPLLPCRHDRHHQRLCHLHPLGSCRGRHHWRPHLLAVFPVYPAHPEGGRPCRCDHSALHCWSSRGDVVSTSAPQIKSLDTLHRSCTMLVRFTAQMRLDGH